jgi:hypothetical protein
VTPVSKGELARYTSGWCVGASQRSIAAPSTGASVSTDGKNVGSFRDVRPVDTDAAAHEVQMGVYRRIGPEARVRIAFEMSEDVRRMTLDGIRARHPEYDGEQSRRALFRLLLGDDLVRAIWPGEAPVAP